MLNVKTRFGLLTLAKCNLQEPRGQSKQNTENEKGFGLLCAEMISFSFHLYPKPYKTLVVPPAPFNKVYTDSLRNPEEVLEQTVRVLYVSYR